MWSSAVRASPGTAKTAGGPGSLFFAFNECFMLMKTAVIQSAV